MNITKNSSRPLAAQFFQRSFLYQSSMPCQSSSNICQRPLNLALYFKERAMEDVKYLWLKFNEYSNKLAAALERTSNIVGEYAEHLAYKHYGGRLLEISGSSADIETADGTLYQEKSKERHQLN